MIAPPQAYSRLVVTPGEPAGIGPDLMIRLAQQEIHRPLIAIADPDLLATRAQQINQSIEVISLESPNEKTTEAFTGHGKLLCLPVTLNDQVTIGELNVNNAEYVLNTLRKATELCLTGQAGGLITGPIHKGIINQAGIPFTGHTEFLAELSQTKQVIMMLATEGLKVALVTTHLPLKEISDAITRDLLYDVISLLDQEMRNKFALDNPKIFVCGLNPHAGEDGHMGREEIDTIIPVLKDCQEDGLGVSGPYPADTVFTEKYLAQADTVLAMYHDQGLPVLKYKGFGRAVNITLGLPFIRTSVDHGTALELAGTEQVNLGSMEYAIKIAEQVAINLASHQASHSTIQRSIAR